jgi:apolipoprotein N-acyltransferase
VHRIPRLLLRVGGAALGGGALTLAFPGYGMWPLAPIGIALVALATTGTRARIGALVGLVSGLAFFLPTLSWSGIYLGDLPWVALACCQSAYLVLMGAVCARLQRDRVRPLVVALAWVGQEALRDRTPYGGFPWVRVAFSQADSPFARLAALAGAPGVTFAVALCGGLLALGLRYAARPRSPRLAAVVGVAAVGVGALGLAVPVPTDGPPARVLAVQGNVPRAGLDFNAERRQVLDNHVQETVTAMRAIRGSALPGPDLVVWPENASDIDPIRNADAVTQINRALSATGVPIVVGGLLEEPLPRISNASLLYVPGQGVVTRYVKQHPVPFAEYIPDRSFWRLFSTDVDLLQVEQAAGPGPVVFQVPSASGTPIAAGPSICFEVAYDELVRANVTAGANLLLVQTNNATFGYTSESVQQLAISRIRAIELGRSVVHVSTVGVSALIMPDGTVEQPTALFTAAAPFGALPLRETRTAASLVGPWPEYSACVSLLLLLGWHVRRPRSSRPPSPAERTDPRL